MMKAKIKKFLYGDQDALVDKKELLIISLGSFFMFYGVFAMTLAITRGKASWILWMCYTGLFFIGIATLRKNGFIIGAFLNTVFLSLIIWNFDFIMHLITGESFWGVTNFFFEEMTLAARFVSLEHFFLAPVGLLLLYLVKLNRKDSWKLSIFIIFVSGWATYLFTDKAENVNCAFESCTTLLGGSYYQIIWMGVLYLMAILSGLAINRFSIFFSQEFKDKNKLKR